MARPETLVPGNCYFSVMYYDDELMVPMIQTLVYVGEEDDPDHGRAWLFKEPESAAADAEEGVPSDTTALILFPASQLHAIVDIDGLMKTLREVAADHPLNPVPQPVTESATAEEFASLSGEIASFLSDPHLNSLTITIRFTDDGLSLGRRDTGYDMHFFSHPRRDPDRDERILALLNTIGIHPFVDYLCDRGRTRVLGFPIPGDHDAVVALCRRVFAEVFSMRRGDSLDYRPLKKSEF